MKNFRIVLVLIGAICSSVIFTNCGTIFGGSKYWAKVHVVNHPNAKIEYKGMVRGTGEANFKAPRRDANMFNVAIQEEGCEREVKEFRGRTFRGWALVGSIVGWTGTINGVPMPWGVVLDISTGSYWKPDIHQPGISKIDYNHYIYQINYTGCESKKKEIKITDTE